MMQVRGAIGAFYFLVEEVEECPLGEVYVALPLPEL